MGYLVCSVCNKKYSLDEIKWRCDCGGYLNIEFDAVIDKNSLNLKNHTMWRYRRAIPINDDKNIVSFNEGFTPLVKVSLSSKEVLLKLDYLFPSGSYKDRGASVLISKAKELGVRNIVEDSSGNAGCAISSYAAKAGINCDIYVPEETSEDKLVQIQAYGAVLHRVQGDRLKTSEVALSAAKDSYYASHTWNPFFMEGTKTFAYEIWEQLGFMAPDTLILPVGNGTILIGAYKGFEDLRNNRLIEHMPSIIAVQSEGCAPIYEMFENSLNYVPIVEERHTMAEGIAINKPLRGRQIVDIINKTNGDVVTVSDEEIKESLNELFKMGLYVEPTSVSTIAALKKCAVNGITVATLTGSGLKSTSKNLQLIKYKD